MNGKSAATWAIVAGVLLVITGFIALGSEMVAGFLSVLLLGWLFTIGGVVEFAEAFRMRGTHAFTPMLLSGILSFFAGIVLVMHPAMGAEALIVLLGAYFIVGGAYKVIAAIANRHEHTGWAVFSGAVDLLLGFLLWNAFMGQSLALIGIFVAITMIFRGMFWIMAGMALRKVAA